MNSLSRRPQMLFLAAMSSYLVFGAAAGAQTNFLKWAATPPMGWNSWDCFATTVTEAQTKAQADYMAEHLKSHGWQYIVVDIQWYEPRASSFNYRRNAQLTMDEWGRLLPATNRFPSAANGVGFKALADYVHAKGLKFGIHLMRGIPRQAVRANTAVLGTSHRAQDIADVNSTCPWNPDMYGVDMTKPGAQDYYNSVFDLIASWGVDYVKVDDISRPYHEHQKEVEAVRTAIDNSGRPIVLSLSPGETPLTAAEHVMNHANLWRISDDFWDNWPALHEQFTRLNNWTPYRAPGHWPDADMLPLGVIDMGRRSTRFTRDEQYTLMTLWAVARSPLMHGGDMTKMDDFTLSLLTNDEVLAVNQNSSGNRQLFRRNEQIAWIADVPNSKDKYLALFNAPATSEVVEQNAVFKSPLVTRETPGHGVDVDVDITGAKKLYLVATDGGDNNFGDHVDWVEPRLVSSDGEKKLTELKWAKAATGWGNVAVDKDAGGGPMNVAGKKVSGIGAHAQSVIEFDLPPGSTRFKAFAALDDEGTILPRGATVRFYVFTNEPFATDALAKVPVRLEEIGLNGSVRVRDLWQQKDIGRFEAEFAPEIAPHGAGLYRLAAAQTDGSAGGASISSAPESAYLFSYFTGNGEDGLHLAWSRDGLKWETLNGGKSFLTPKVGESKLMRDPCLLRGPDGTFHMVWTTAWEGKTIGYASSKDLIHWSEQRAIPVMAHEPAAKNCWAPEITWDEKQSEFLIFWATTITNQFLETAGGGDNNHRIYATTTKDFKTFTPTRLFYDPAFNVIDATLLRANGRFYLIIKDETRNPPKKHLRIASSDDIEGPFTNLSPPFTRDWVEGPTALKVGNDYVVYFDAYRDHHYEAMRSADLKSWQDITPQISFPPGTRHGTALDVPVEVLEGLLSANVPTPARDNP